MGNGFDQKNNNSGNNENTLKINFKIFNSNSENRIESPPGLFRSHSHDPKSSADEEKITKKELGLKYPKHQHKKFRNLLRYTIKVFLHFSLARKIYQN